jgi:hypothetical protein
MNHGIIMNIDDTEAISLGGGGGVTEPLAADTTWPIITTRKFRHELFRYAQPWLYEQPAFSERLSVRLLSAYLRRNLQWL